MANHYAKDYEGNLILIKDPKIRRAKIKKFKKVVKVRQEILEWSSSDQAFTNVKRRTIKYFTDEAKAKSFYFKIKKEAIENADENKTTVEEVIVYEEYCKFEKKNVIKELNEGVVISD